MDGGSLPTKREGREGGEASDLPTPQSASDTRGRRWGRSRKPPKRLRFEEQIKEAGQRQKGQVRLPRRWRPQARAEDAACVASPAHRGVFV